MIVGAKQDAAGGRQRPGNAGAVGHGAESRQLTGVHPVARIIRTGQMRHQKARCGSQRLVRNRPPVGVLQTQPVHAGIELQPEGVAGQGGPVARPLIGRIQHRDQARVADHPGIARHMPGEDEDLRPGPQGVADRGALMRLGHEEAARARTGKGRGDPVRPEAIAIRLDHRARLCRARKRRQGPPVAGDRVEVDGKNRLCHGASFRRRCGGVQGPWNGRKRGQKSLSIRIRRHIFSPISQS